MKTLILTLVTLAIFLLLAGLLFVAFSLFGKKQPDTDSCESASNSNRSFGCGCGSGACGLPVERQNG